MTTFLKSILLFPLDLLFLTWDSWRIWVHGSAMKSYRIDGLQNCIYCKEWNLGAAPRRCPPGVRKYKNRWLIRCMQPCLTIDKDTHSRPRTLCNSAQGFLTYPRQIPFVALGLSALWIGVGIGLYLLIQHGGSPK